MAEGLTIKKPKACVDANTFYVNGKDYWAKVPATVDGMLGGFTHISSIDIQTSKRFLMPFLNGKKAKTGHTHALDCGAGIGRVTKHLLSHIFDKVDMLEQNPAFLEESQSYLGDQRSKVDQLLSFGLQDFLPEKQKYDVIWVQWVFSHIPEDGVCRFLRNCKTGLKANGLLIVKENLSGSGEVEQDDTDCTITRPGRVIRDMIRKAGFVISKEMRQPKFPAELYEVRMFACRVAGES